MPPDRHGILDRWTDNILQSQPLQPDNGQAGISPPPTKTSRSGPTEQEWTERRPLITLLYSSDENCLNLTLTELMRVMETIGFLQGYVHPPCSLRCAVSEQQANTSYQGRRLTCTRSVSTNGESSKTKVQPGVGGLRLEGPTHCRHRPNPGPRSKPCSKLSGPFV